MSLFSSRVVCEDVKFFSHHIDPISSGLNGVLTIANGHTTLSQAPDQQYILSVDASNNKLEITTQSSSPAPIVECLSLLPGGGLDVHNHTIANVADPVNASDAVPKSYVDAKGGASHKQFVVSEPAPPAPIFNHTTMATLDVSGMSGNLFTLYFNNINGSLSTGGQGCAYDVYISETLNGVFDSTKGCLKWNSGVVTNGNQLNSGAVTMLYVGSSQPSALYINVFQTNSAQSGVITNLNFTVDVVAVNTLPSSVNPPIELV
jgi:hypothetical protein